MKRVTQVTSSHCGPATLEMLASFLGIYISQNSFVSAAGVEEKLETHGMTIEEMKKAVGILLPDCCLWTKNGAGVYELSNLINNYHFPVGVEWQGVFFEDEDDDNGHYSVVTHIDTVNNLVMLADPYRRFAGEDRRFPIIEFESRWWDENEIKDPATGSVRIERDEKLLFVLTPKETTFPQLLGMQKD